tara:strand:- start:918 stop:1133 length:216 start_codon:yes stop_codon:yes gene_type:complete
MILASGARGRGFNSRTAPFFSIDSVPIKKNKKILRFDFCTLFSWVLSSAVEHGIADPAVAGSIPAAPFFWA